MTDKTKAPEQMTDADMDAISGGPHFRIFHGASFDCQSGCDTVLVKTEPVAGPTDQTQG